MVAIDPVLVARMTPFVFEMVPEWKEKFILDPVPASMVPVLICDGPVGVNDLAPLNRSTPALLKFETLNKFVLTLNVRPAVISRNVTLLSSPPDPAVETVPVVPRRRSSPDTSRGGTVPLSHVAATFQSPDRSVLV
jgi:hypothetical protein